MRSALAYIKAGFGFIPVNRVMRLPLILSTFILVVELIGESALAVEIMCLSSGFLIGRGIKDYGAIVTITELGTVPNVFMTGAPYLPTRGLSQGRVHSLLVSRIVSTRGRVRTYTVEYMYSRTNRIGKRVFCKD